MIWVVGAIARGERDRFEVSSLIERIDRAPRRVDDAVVIDVRVTSIPVSIFVRVPLIRIGLVRAVVVAIRDSVPVSIFEGRREVAVNDELAVRVADEDRGDTKRGDTLPMGRDRGLSPRPGFDQGRGSDRVRQNRIVEMKRERGGSACEPAVDEGVEGLGDSAPDFFAARITGGGRRQREDDARIIESCRRITSDARDHDAGGRFRYLGATVADTMTESGKAIGERVEERRRGLGALRRGRFARDLPERGGAGRFFGVRGVRGFGGFAVEGIREKIRAGVFVVLADASGAQSGDKKTEGRLGLVVAEIFEGSRISKEGIGDPRKGTILGRG